jgi:hypothetical protein
MWKVAMWPIFKVLSWHLNAGTEEIHEEAQSRYPVSGTRFEPGTCLIRSRSGEPSLDILLNLNISRTYHPRYAEMRQYVRTG